MSDSHRSARGRGEKESDGSRPGKDSEGRSRASGIERRVRVSSRPFSHEGPEERRREQEALIDRTVDDSFPASDPPTFSGGSAPDEPPVPDAEIRRRRREEERKENGPFRTAPVAPEEEGFLEDEDGVAMDPVFVPASERSDAFDELPSRGKRGDEGVAAEPDEGEDLDDPDEFGEAEEDEDLDALLDEERDEDPRF